MHGIRSGTLHGSDGHHASGTARLDATTLTLTLEKVDRVPDGRVYLAIGGDRITSYNVCYTKLLRFLLC